MTGFRSDRALSRATNVSAAQPTETNATARKAKSNEELARNITEFAIASRCMERTQSYILRGRQLKNATVDELRTRFVEMFRIWRADLWWEGLSQLHDVEAEFKLRGVSPPFALVIGDVGQIMKAFAGALSRVDAEVMAELNAELIDEYFAASRSRN